MPEGGQQVEKEGLRFAFFIALQFGGEIGKLTKGPFLRCHRWSGNLNNTGKRLQKAPDPTSLLSRTFEV
jgi:hypothetical protein